MLTGTMTTAHAICSGLMAALGGIFLASRVGAAYPLSGTGYELYAIAAVVIGGAKLTGGVGNVSGTVAGTLIMGRFRTFSIFNASWIRCGSSSSSGASCSRSFSCSPSRDILGESEDTKAGEGRKASLTAGGLSDLRIGVKMPCAVNSFRASFQG